MARRQRGDVRGIHAGTVVLPEIFIPDGSIPGARSGLADGKVVMICGVRLREAAFKRRRVAAVQMSGACSGDLYSSRLVVTGLGEAGPTLIFQPPS